MPYLRGLVAGGTSFEQYYVTNALLPSRASYMTGLYPHHHGITDNTPTWEEIANVKHAHSRLGCSKPATPQRT